MKAIGKVFWLIPYFCLSLFTDINCLYSFRLCHTIAKRYLELLRHETFTCSIPEQYRQILPDVNPNSLTNYNWNHPDNVLHMQIGLSCCPSPNESDLSKVWSRHRSSLIDLFSSLQGIHIIVENLDHRFTDGENDAFVYIACFWIIKLTNNIEILWRHIVLT